MREVKVDYKKIGLKVGLEIHFQLDVEKKLFCDCSTKMEEKNHKFVVVRKLYPTFSELGELDLAARYEYLRDRVFFYYFFEKECCLVELDEEPPHDVNLEALQIALQIAKLFNCKIPDEIHVMRKIVIDGSNTSGFQRTMIVGFDGYFEYKNRKVPIAQICLEEDAAAIEKEENGKVYYRLNRLGIPLVEISTGVLDGFDPKEIEEIAYQIFLISSSTQKIRRMLGAIRQDINVSIKNGARVEIKGIQRLGLISMVIEKEVERQTKLIEEGKSVEKETRAAKEDGSTEYMRPLPGAERMYPETDIKPVFVREILKNLKIPEPIPAIVERYEKDYKLSKELINSLLKSKYFFTFDRIVKSSGVDPKVVANVLTATIKEIERKEKVEFDLDDKKIEEFFDGLKNKKFFKEAAYDVLKEMNKNKEASLEEILENLNLKPLSEEEIKKIIEEEKKNVKDRSKLVGIVLSKVRGRADVQKVLEMLKE
ncbi:MAG: Glu-tRNA(Gln) amidotransferase subunit GatE [Candidatus Aenigmarchaeota archaeon]|nr:Glu-tRNA(Gln) amidotransferase subunit GatE [Candidatus Aenigmarchaeota archaeon]MCX8191034.1 Glu-tRNA(Gln) amidotransferase subunit GatE [Candidatus Aenigmarchaeota archaeon]MDW8160310.1 Glu-tRNA(Gln) amidotransferase subunit GatE [Candidatus Aenigmarchaeota archaeon]